MPETEACNPFPGATPETFIAALDGMMRRVGDTCPMKKVAKKHKPGRRQAGFTSPAFRPARTRQQRPASQDKCESSRKTVGQKVGYLKQWASPVPLASSCGLLAAQWRTTSPPDVYIAVVERVSVWLSKLPLRGLLAGNHTNLPYDRINLLPTPQDERLTDGP
jgi:hypothetical protein